VIKYQGVGKEWAGFRAVRPGSKPKQANVNPSHICVSDLESVLGANVTELREIIMKYKSEKADTAENSQGKEKVAGSKLNPQRITGDNLVDGRKSRCKNIKSKEEKSEMIDNKGNCDSSLLLLAINYDIQSCKLHSLSQSLKSIQSRGQLKPKKEFRLKTEHFIK
jgi:hypothetical protein